MHTGSSRVLLARQTRRGGAPFEHDVPSLHRVHEPPDIKKVMDFDGSSPRWDTVSWCRPTTRPKDFQRLVDRISGTPEERPIAALMMRTMQKAGTTRRAWAISAWRPNSTRNFTSPIRRYPDLIVHRTLRLARHEKLTPARREELEEDLPETAKHSSEMERRADEAERELLQWKKVRFMADKVGDEYEGYITGVAPYGLFVELIEHYVEGMVHVSSMADDYYRFLEQQHVMRGENTKKVYRLGDKVNVQVVRVDMERRQIDLESWRYSMRCGVMSGHAPHPHTTKPKREQKRTQRPGRRERKARKGK